MSRKQNAMFLERKPVQIHARWEGTYALYTKVPSTPQVKWFVIKSWLAHCVQGLWVTSIIDVDAKYFSPIT